MRDAREQLLAAAERVLVRDGPRRLTSRAVTEEAGCAKGVLHKHFSDFDEFVAELVRDRMRLVVQRSDALERSVGSGSVSGNVSGALADVFATVAVAVVGLVVFRDDLRSRFREEQVGGVPVLREAAGMLGRYLEAERDAGRVAPEADTETLALVLVGSAHLLYAGGGRPADGELARIVDSVLEGAAG